ncbi:MAG TPA: NAD(P)H-dependent oxidoreductase [Kofleriaceae bacterium]|jgi:NAD(P)H-dependent FMN reductase
MSDKPKLHVILGSTRPGRKGLSVAQWFVDRAKAHATFDVTFVDLAEVNLPLIDEPHHPRLQNYTKDHTKKWSAIVKAADAFVFVTPEYNYSAAPALTNAFDYLFKEWAYAPAATVSYGGVSGGLRAVTQTRNTISALKMMPIPEAIVIPFFTNHIVDDKFAKDTEALDKAVPPMLDELAKWTHALGGLRAGVRS